jgi:hypothetical protein
MARPNPVVAQATTPAAESPRSVPRRQHPDPAVPARGPTPLTRRDRTNDHPYRERSARAFSARVGEVRRGDDICGMSGALTPATALAPISVAAVGSAAKERIFVLANHVGMMYTFRL